jgi:DNA-binding NarL/FixJ family response regulator
MSGTKTKVVIVDDHKMVLDSLSLLLSTYPDFEVVATFTDARKVMPFVISGNVDLIITDSRMPLMDGFELSRTVLSYQSDFKIVMISMIEDPAEIRRALDLGISAYLPKFLSSDELITAIRDVVMGKKYLSNESILTLHAPAVESTKQLNGLTGRELEIIRLIAQELSTSEIAEKLFISVPTVETHRKNLFQKTGVKNAIGLVLFAIKNKLLD